MNYHTGEFISRPTNGRVRNNRVTAERDNPVLLSVKQITFCMHLKRGHEPEVMGYIFTYIYICLYH